MSDILQTRGLTKVYATPAGNLEVLKGVDLKISRKEFVCIVGPSGAGKSTLLHLLGGIDLPSSGKVFFGGVDLYSLSDREMSVLLNRKAGFVFQFYHLLPDFTALENVSLPMMISGSGDKKRPAYLMEKFGLGLRMQHFPSQLSGGEQQRLAIIRALVNTPEILFCDEPTGNLDSDNGREVLKILDELNREEGTTIVTVTHDRSVAGFARRVIHLKDGRVVGS